MQQMSGVGFCLLTNVEGHDEETLLTAIKAFHELPLEVKMKMAPKHYKGAENNENTYQGYFPFLQGDVSLKEFYSLPRPYEEISDWERDGCPLYEPLSWTPDQKYDWILKRFQKHWKVMHTFAMKLNRLFALGLGKPLNYFDPWFKDECTSTCRTIHYISREEEGADPAEYKLVTPEHPDSGFITLLTTFMFSGLEVLIDGEYKPIKPIKNAIIVNLG